MAELTSGDHPVNGAVEGLQERRDAADGQTFADHEQTLADADQTASDNDQTAADSDQAAADSDQVASDRDLAHGGDVRAHKLTRGLRERNAQRRGETARRRFRAAAARDAIADERDRTAAARDRAAAAWDREQAAREVAWPVDGRPATGGEILLRAAENRRRAAADREAAAEGRARAATDRAQAAEDRKQAARDRAHAQADREALMHQLLVAETDALTGARTRGAGLADLDHEIDRARRLSGRLVAAYVDVVGLKAVNDLHGHAAGDRLLQRAVRAIRGQLRTYDVIVRVGGDEFVCALSGATMRQARRRFASVQAALAADPEPCEIKVGFAALAPEESAAKLIERADAELPTTPLPTRTGLH